MAVMKKLYVHKTKPGVLVDANGKEVTLAEMISVNESRSRVALRGEPTGHVDAMESARTVAPPATQNAWFKGVKERDAKAQLVESFKALGMTHNKACHAASAEFLLRDLIASDVPVNECDRLIKNLLTPTEHELHEDSRLVRHLLDKDASDVPLNEADRLTKNLLTPIEHDLHEDSKLVRHLLSKETK